jgi:hypothetical protein
MGKRHAVLAALEAHERVHADAPRVHDIEGLGQRREQAPLTLPRVPDRLSGCRTDELAGGAGACSSLQACSSPRSRQHIGLGSVHRRWSRTRRSTLPLLRGERAIDGYRGSLVTQYALAPLTFVGLSGKPTVGAPMARVVPQASFE